MNTSVMSKIKPILNVIINYFQNNKEKHVKKKMCENSTFNSKHFSNELICTECENKEMALFHVANQNKMVGKASALRLKIY